MKKSLLLLLFFYSVNFSYAAMKGLTHHSRANCLGINETISWDGTSRHKLAIVSKHFKSEQITGGDLIHINTDPASRIYDYDSFINTWRAAIVHVGEARGKTKWRVEGVHYVYYINMFNQYNYDIYSTTTIDCDLYNGWWNKDHPERASK